MPRIHTTKLDSMDYAVLVLLLCMSSLQIWKHSPEIKGVLGGSYIEYSTVPGKIKTSGTRKFGGGLNSTSSGYNIWYNYTVNEVTYKSNLITFDAHVKKVDKYLRKYPVDKTITVYYQTNNPKFSVLEPESISWGVVFRPLIPLPILLVYLWASKKNKIKFKVKGKRS